MKIAITSPYYPPHLGGIELHVKNLAEELAKRHRVEVISSCGESSRVRVRRVRCLNIPYSPIPLQRLNLEADVTHHHIPSPFFALAFNSRPSVVTYHNDIVIPDVVNGFKIPLSLARCIELISKRVMRKVVRDADIVIATTLDYALTSDILRECMDKVCIIPNGIRVSDFTYTKDKEDYVIYVGRVVEYKGLGVLLEAISNTKEKLLIAGEGEDRVRFERIAKKLNVNAKFLRKVDHKRLSSLIAKAKCLVLPSKNRLEAFGIVLLEAMACGTPVVASNIPGVRWVAKKGGFVFNNSDELREIITNLDERDVKVMGRRGRKFAERHDWSLIAKKVERIYEEVI